FRPVCVRAFEGQFGLPLAGGYFSPPGTVGLEALVEFTAPFLVGLRVKRQVSSGGMGVLPFGIGLRRITKNTCARALGEHCATLQADFIHRCVLRCGRSHSGEEEPLQITTSRGKSTTMECRGVAKESVVAGLKFNLLREHCAAVGDTPVQCDGGEVGAARLLVLCPGAQR